jgi:hypothetical protein
MVSICPQPDWVGLDFFSYFTHVGIKILARECLSGGLFKPFLMGRTHVIHRRSVDVVCVICTFSVLIVDARPQIICESCLCCFSLLMCRVIRRDEIHRSYVDLVCVFLLPYHNLLLDTHRSFVDVDKNCHRQNFGPATDGFHLWQNFLQ